MVSTTNNTFSMTVAAEDANGNVDPTYTGNVTLTLATNPTAATLGGVTTVAAVAGVATFTNLPNPPVGTAYTVLASSGSLTPVTTTTAFNITPQAATRLVVTTQPPATVTAGSPFAVIVTLEDAFGNVVTTATTSQVTLTPAGNSGLAGATFGGTLTATPVNGVATFSNLTLTQVGTGYSYSVTGAPLAGLAPTTTSAIAVTGAAATQLVVTSQPPSSVVANAKFGLVVTAEDPFGNPSALFNGAGRHPRPGEQPRRGRARRHADRGGHGGRGNVLGPVGEPAVRQLHDPGFQWQPDRNDDDSLCCRRQRNDPSRDGLPVGSDDRGPAVAQPGCRRQPVLGLRHGRG